MVVYNFKKIRPVPPGNDFLDIVLSKTQRKTPTVVHPQYQISRIRQFYMRKVKFAQQTFHDKLSEILEDFPILDDIHPFYADLMNVLYDRDHYKLALGQLNTCRHLIDTIAKDYLKLLKYGDSLYRCKQLKRAALGRMCTLVKKQSASLAYLDQVRQHLARLPSIDPNTRTLILCGYPNVGKSSFLNRITRANVDVQPYPFTTKSLYVGHTDYEFLRWQVIDTPGILDHPLESRNTIEMQSITALAHLRAAVLFLMDISEQCGYSIQQQVALFKSIQPLFANKPVLLVCNKIDVVRFENLKEEDKELINSLCRDGVELVPMSTATEEGVSAVKELACKRLLEHRVEAKLKGKKTNDILNRLHLATPAPRDNKERPPVIPESVIKARENGTSDMDTDDKTKEEEDEEANKPFWLRGFGSTAWKKKYLLEDPDWRFHNIPEIIDGHNIADFIDPEIEEKLDALERDEEAREAAAEDEMEDEDDVELTEEQMETVKAIRERKKLIVQAHRENKGKNGMNIPRKLNPERDLSTFESHLAEMGIDPSAASERIRSRSQSRAGRKRSRSESMAIDGEDEQVTKARKRSVSKTPAQEGLKDEKQKQKVEQISKKSQKVRNKLAKKGEGDRVILNLRPKHLLSGKRKSGKTQRR